MTDTFKPAGAALAAVVAGLSAPATVVAQAPDLGGVETPMAQADAFARGLAALAAGEPLAEPSPNSALLDVPLGGLEDSRSGFG